MTTTTTTVDVESKHKSTRYHRGDIIVNDFYDLSHASTDEVR